MYQVALCCVPSFRIFLSTIIRMISELISRNGTIVMRASNAGLKCWLSLGRIFSHA